MWPHFIDNSIVSILASMGMYTIPYKSVKKFLLINNSTIISHYQLQIHDFLQQYSIQSDIDNITYNKLTIYRHSPSLTLLIRTQYKKTNHYCKKPNKMHTVRAKALGYLGSNGQTSITFTCIIIICLTLFSFTWPFYPHPSLSQIHNTPNTFIVLRTDADRYIDMFRTNSIEFITIHRPATNYLTSKHPATH